MEEYTDLKPHESNQSSFLTGCDVKVPVMNMKFLQIKKKKKTKKPSPWEGCKECKAFYFNGVFYTWKHPLKESKTVFLNC